MVLGDKWLCEQVCAGPSKRQRLLLLESSEDDEIKAEPGQPEYTFPRTTNDDDGDEVIVLEWCKIVQQVRCIVKLYKTIMQIHESAYTTYHIATCAESHLS